MKIEHRLQERQHRRRQSLITISYDWPWMSVFLCKRMKSRKHQRYSNVERQLGCCNRLLQH